MGATPEFVDYYAILGTRMDAPWSELKVAYLRQALVLHPDKNSDPNATAMFQLLNQAWEVLKDVDSRMGYDSVFLQKMNTQPSSRQYNNGKVQEMRESKEATVVKQHAHYLAMLFKAENRTLEAYQRQLEKDLEVSSAIYAQQRAYSQASNGRAKAANHLYQQRVKALRTEVHSHNTAITGLKFQLDIVKAELVVFDMQDAIDMQLEDERHLPAAAIAARAEREAKRAFNETLTQDLTTEIQRLGSRIQHAKATLEKNHRQDCIRTARLSLRDLQQLKSKNAFAGHGEKKFAFWNAIRRAATKAAPSAEDLKVYEQYRHELERPVYDLHTGALPSRQAVEEYAFSCVKETSGMFSMAGF